MNQLCVVTREYLCSTWLLFHASAMKAEFLEVLTFISVVTPITQHGDENILGAY